MFRIMITSLGGLKTLSATALHVCVKCLLMTNKTLGSRIKYISKKKGRLRRRCFIALPHRKSTPAFKRDVPTSKAIFQILIASWFIFFYSNQTKCGILWCLVHQPLASRNANVVFTQVSNFVFRLHTGTKGLALFNTFLLYQCRNSCSNSSHRDIQ